MRMGVDQPGQHQSTSKIYRLAQQRQFICSANRCDATIFHSNPTVFIKSVLTIHSQNRAVCQSLHDPLLTSGSGRSGTGTPTRPKSHVPTPAPSRDFPSRRSLPR